jgi:hypothetical protein
MSSPARFFATGAAEADRTEVPFPCTRSAADTTARNRHYPSPRLLQCPSMGRWAGRACFATGSDPLVLHVLTPEVEDTGRGQALCGATSSTWVCAGHPRDVVGTPCSDCPAARGKLTRIVLVPADEWTKLMRDLAATQGRTKPTRARPEERRLAVAG